MGLFSTRGNVNSVLVGLPVNTLAGSDHPSNLDAQFTNVKETVLPQRARQKLLKKNSRARKKLDWKKLKQKVKRKVKRKVKNNWRAL